VEYVRERLVVSKKISQRLRRDIKKINEEEGKGQYRVEVSNRCAALEELEDGVDIVLGQLQERISKFLPRGFSLL
jgi:hypothetical protein